MSSKERKWGKIHGHKEIENREHLFGFATAHG
jgi:hypothetical protein